MGRTDDIAQEVAKRREFDVEIPGNPGLKRIEDLLCRALLRMGDKGMLDEMDKADAYDDRRPPKPPSAVSMETPLSQDTREGSLFDDSNGIYSEELNPRRRAPVNSFASSYDARRKDRWSGVPTSLLDGSIPEMDFNEDMAMADLPPDTPPEEYIVPRPQIPPHLANQLPRYRSKSQTEDQYDDERYPSEYASEHPGDEQEQEPSEYTEPLDQDEGDRTPVPYRPEDEDQQEGSTDYDEESERGRRGRLPPPQPVDLPTPVRSDGDLPPLPPNQMGQMGQMGDPMSMYGGMPPPPPGMSQMPRPSLPRIAGVRDPISTT